MKPPEKPTPRQILSANVKALMAARKDDLGTIKKIAAASGTKLSNGKVGRICKASHTTDIDSLQHLAEVFKVEPWQLLVEGLKPDALPVVIDATVIAALRQAVAQKADQEQSREAARKALAGKMTPSTTAKRSSRKTKAARPA